MTWQDLQNETTQSLLEYMNWGSDPQFKEAGDDAFIVFCYRYREDLQRKTRIIAGRWGYDSVTADEIAAKAFERFYKYRSFKSETCGKKEIDLCVKLYLYKIAGNVLADYRKAITHGNPWIGDEEVIRDLPDLDQMDLTPERKAVLQAKYAIVIGALNRLGPKHKIIYLTCKHYEEQLNEGFYLPKHLQKALRDELELSQASLRVYKKEAFDTVTEYLKIYGSK